MPEPDAAPEYCGYTTYESTTAAEDLPNTGEGTTGLERAVWDALFEVEDPEMPVSVVDLGLIYGVVVEPESPDDESGARVRVRMTLTYTGCPAREMLLSDVEAAARAVEGVESAAVELVWNPPWNLELVTEAGKESLREFGVSV